MRKAADDITCPANPAASINQDQLRSIQPVLASKAALTSQSIEVGKRRSHFGCGDSWFIKRPGAANPAVGI
jgi:hypothetical protein